MTIKSVRGHLHIHTHTHTQPLCVSVCSGLIWFGRETRILKVIVGEQQNKTQKIRNDGTGTFIYYIIPVEYCVSVCVSVQILCLCHPNNKVHVNFFFFIFAYLLSFFCLAFNRGDILLSCSFTLCSSIHSISFRCPCHSPYTYIYSFSAEFFFVHIGNFSIFSFFSFLLVN